MTRILKGHPVARQIEAEVKARCRQLVQSGIQPGLAVVVSPIDAPSQVYARMIERGCQRVGIGMRREALPEPPTFLAAAGLVERLNADRAVHGILIKRPLPGELADERLLQVTAPGKDVDGYHFANVGRMVVGAGLPSHIPCTPAGVLELLQRSDYSPAGLHVVILGRSATVGKPLANLLLQKGPQGDATVTVCHRSTPDFSRYTRAANIVVTAVGCPGFLRAEHVASGAIVIDVGTNSVPDPASPQGYRLVGDADYAGLVGHCRAITPVPGGVGPVTVALLLRNVVASAEHHSGAPSPAA